MKRRIEFLFWVILLIASGCEDDKEKRSTKAPKEVPKERVGTRMKSVDELRVVWDQLGKKGDEDPELWKKVVTLYEKDVQTTLPPSKKAVWEDFYRILGDPNTNPAVARDALQVFIDANAMDVVRESVINPRRDVPGWGLVAAASETLGATRDQKAIPYLIRSLSINNKTQEGSERATVHVTMKRRLLEAIQKITRLDAGIGKTDVNDPQQVERVISLAKDWAKQHNIPLLDE